MLWDGSLCEFCFERLCPSSTISANISCDECCQIFIIFTNYFIFCCQSNWLWIENPKFTTFEVYTHTHTHHVSHICQCKIDNEWGISPGESTFLFFEQINCLLSLLLFHFTVFLRIFHLFSSSLSVSQFLCLFPSSSLVYSHIFTILTIPSRNQTNKQTISHTKINNYLLQHPFNKYIHPSITNLQKNVFHSELFFLLHVIIILLYFYFTLVYTFNTICWWNVLEDVFSLLKNERVGERKREKRNISKKLFTSFAGCSYTRIHTHTHSICGKCIFYLSLSRITSWFN